jgi:tetratricopeptide (TPR) repeat protein
MMTRTFCLLLLLATAGDDGPGQGRRGNRLYQQRQYTQAAATYQSGLDPDLTRTPGPISAGLANNLGAAHYRQQDYARAQEAFIRSMHLATTPADVSRAAYNAGNTAFNTGNLEAALDFYRQALRHNPQNEDARFNYEYLRRQMQQQRQPGGQGQNQQQQPQQSPDQPQGSQQQQPPQDGQDQQGQQDPQQPNPQDQPPQQNQQGEQSPSDEDDTPAQASQQEPNRLSRRQAEQLLQALENEEELLLRQARKLQVAPRPVEKDW